MNTPTTKHFLTAGIALGLLIWLMIKMPVFESAQMKERRKMQRESEARIDFFGKVVDEQDNPVQGASVKIHMRYYQWFNYGNYFTGRRDWTTRTNNNGEFSVKGERGFTLSIDSIRKQGYDSTWVFIKGNNYFEYEPSLARQFRPDSKSPVIYRLRKKGAADWVWEHHTGIRFYKSDPDYQSPRGFDAVFDYTFVPSRWDRTKPPSYPDEPFFPDLVVQALSAQGQTTWTLVFRPGDPGGGIQVLDEKLYVAPEFGYGPYCSWVVDSEARTKNPRHLTDDKWLYLRSRNPPIFIRVNVGEIEAGRASAQEVGFGLSFTTNPFGSRVLEQATDLPTQVKLDIGNAVRSAFTQGRRPPADMVDRKMKEWRENKFFMQRWIDRLYE